jgi:hypothetical protein
MWAGISTPGPRNPPPPPPTHTPPLPQARSAELPPHPAPNPSRTRSRNNRQRARARTVTPPRTFSSPLLSSPLLRSNEARRTLPGLSKDARRSWPTLGVAMLKVPSMDSTDSPDRDPPKSTLSSRRRTIWRGGCVTRGWVGGGVCGGVGVCVRIERLARAGDREYQGGGMNKGKGWGHDGTARVQA